MMRNSEDDNWDFGSDGLPNANFSYSSLLECSLRQCSLTCASFVCAATQGPTFKGAKMPPLPVSEDEDEDACDYAAITREGCG